MSARPGDETGEERDRGDWIPWYTDDSPGWLELSLAARGAAEGIARKMGRNRGELHLGSRGLRGLAILLRCTWEELEPALAELLAPGPNGEPPRLVCDEEQRILIDPDHESRKRPTSAERVRKHRAKAALPSQTSPSPEADVTHVTVTGVTSDLKRTETGGNVTSPLLSSDLISEGEREREGTPRRWVLDDPIPDPWRADAEGQIMPTGERIDVDDEWRRYLADRLRPEQAKAVSAADWRGWVLKAVKFARADRQRESDRKAESIRRRDGPPPPPKPTPEQSKRFADELVRRLTARKQA